MDIYIYVQSGILDYVKYDVTYSKTSPIINHLGGVMNHQVGVYIRGRTQFIWVDYSCESNFMVIFV